MLSEILSNQVLTGICGGSVAASILYTLRALPARLWNFLMWKSMSQVFVVSSDASYDAVLAWMSKQDFAKKSRHMNMTSDYSEHEDLHDLSLTLGEGVYWFIYEGKFVLVRHGQNGSQTDRFGRKEKHVTIWTLGSNMDVLRKIVAAVSASRNGIELHTDVYLYRGYWRKVARKEKRSMESIVMPPAQKARIIDDAADFMASRERYRKLGIPYRRGMLLTGPPGTGKTSFVLALAGHLNLRVYAINLGSLSGDSDLISAVTSVPERAVLLIEDIDVAQADRDALPARAQVQPDASKNEVKAITMSALLNVIDGVFSRDGRILIMTTNHPDRLDEALKRPGRADLIEHFGKLGPDEVRVMCRQFLNGSGDRYADTVTEPVTPAELQKALLEKLSSRPVSDGPRPS